MKALISHFLRFFYPGLVGVNVWYVGAVYFPLQKIVGFNRFVKWPVHFTSRVLYKNNITLGKRSYPGMSAGCYIQARNGIVIGNNLRMGPNVGLISADHNLDDYDSWKVCDPIVIGDNVWLGMGAVVLPGVRIGDNVAVAAGAVVTRDVPSNSVVAGIPAKVIASKSDYIGNQYC